MYFLRFSAKLSTLKLFIKRKSTFTVFINKMSPYSNSNYLSSTVSMLDSSSTVVLTVIAIVNSTPQQ